MPRRRQTTVNLKKLETYPALVEELRNNSKYADKDLISLKLTVYDNYEATIKDVDKAINICNTMLLPRKTPLKYFKVNRLSIGLGYPKCSVSPAKL